MFSIFSLSHLIYSSDQLRYRAQNKLLDAALNRSCQADLRIKFKDGKQENFSGIPCLAIEAVLRNSAVWENLSFKDSNGEQFTTQWGDVTVSFPEVKEVQFDIRARPGLMYFQARQLCASQKADSYKAALQAFQQSQQRLKSGKLFNVVR